MNFSFFKLLAKNEVLKEEFKKSRKSQDILKLIILSVKRDWLRIEMRKLGTVLTLMMAKSKDHFRQNKWIRFLIRKK